MLVIDTLIPKTPASPLITWKRLVYFQRQIDDDAEALPNMEKHFARSTPNSSWFICEAYFLKQTHLRLFYNFLKQAQLFSLVSTPIILTLFLKQQPEEESSSFKRLSNFSRLS